MHEPEAQLLQLQQRGARAGVVDARGVEAAVVAEDHLRGLARIPTQYVYKGVLVLYRSI